jgi:hypothetical protein
MWNAQSHQIWQKSRPVAFNLASDNYTEGICFYASNGELIVNFPKQHSENCTVKHQGTNGWFKPTVRILKNMRNRMIDKKMIEEGLAPSYYLEGMLYNAPADKFGGSYNSTVAACINWLLETDRTQLKCANKQYYLLGTQVTWTEAKCAKFLATACDLWQQW